ncbi:MAG: hypothetical protein HC865_17400 [Cyanobacteria bacterium RU_5_0]|nr:hypothetical protein [Cyanobacteria bacterium RU_5_0]
MISEKQTTTVGWAKASVPICYDSLRWARARPFAILRSWVGSLLEIS